MATEITVPGTMQVSYIERDNKVIKSAWLFCDLGRFHVKYDHLNQLDVKEYEAMFIISKIQQCCIEREGQYSFEIEVVVKDIIIHNCSFTNLCLAGSLPKAK